MMLEYGKNTSFNLLHLSSATKIDVFPLKPRAYDHVAFTRIREGRIETDGGGFMTVRGSTAEDLILSKLEGYEMGGRVSDKQWGDIQSILKVQPENLDLAYLRHWAQEIGVDGLLEQALHEANF